MSERTVAVPPPALARPPCPPIQRRPPPSTRRGLLDKCRSLFEHCLWDEALSVSEHSLDPEFIADAIAAALDDLLKAGRTSSLDRWVRAARSAELEGGLSTTPKLSSASVKAVSTGQSRSEGVLATHSQGILRHARTLWRRDRHISRAAQFCGTTTLRPQGGRRRSRRPMPISAGCVSSRRSTIKAPIRNAWPSHCRTRTWDPAITRFESRRQTCTSACSMGVFANGSSSQKDRRLSRTAWRTRT